MLQAVSKADTGQEKRMSRKIDILLCNHFDLIWRRCFLKPLEWKGRSWIPYTKIQEFYMIRCLAMCEKDKNFKFNVECAAVLRQFLKQNPEKEEKIRELLAAGRLDIPFAGDNIIDSNLVQGESIIRNFLYGFRYLNRLGHDGGKMGYRRDSFGNSAQLPQILREFGIKWVWALSYTEADAPVWEGLDKSRIACNEPPCFAESGSIEKYAPCPACRGTGSRDGLVCEACEGKGIDWKAPRFHLPFPGLLQKPEDYSLWSQRSEELIPPWEMLEWPARMTAAWKQKGQQADVRFATFSDLWESMRSHEEALLLEKNADLVRGCELNPNNTGVYVSRIELKKQCRACENRMFELEHLLVHAIGQGMEYSQEDHEEMWQKLLFLMFHDAVTGTIVDAAYDELMETGRKLAEQLDARREEVLNYLQVYREKTAVVYNPGLVSWRGTLPVRLPKGWKACDLLDENGKKIPHLPWRKTEDGLETLIQVDEIGPLSQLVLHMEPQETDRGETDKAADETVDSGSEEKQQQASIENEYYFIEADSHGIVMILDKCSGNCLTDKNGIRVHEIYLEHDEGSPWATLSCERSREALSGRTKLVKKEKNSLYEKLIFKVDPFNVNTVDGMELSWSVTLTAKCRRIDFSMDVEYWDTYNKRIRVAFPAGFTGRALYEIPYGRLERQSYENDCSRWDGASGDWPAIHWAGISGTGRSMAVLNDGTPSYLAEHGENGDILYLSLLRSPCIPTYLHEPRSYDMRDYDGMRDMGRHTFRYGLCWYDSSLEQSDVEREGERFSVFPIFRTGMLSLTDVPKLESDCVRVAAYYPDRGQDRILRLAEYCGRGGNAILHIPEGYEAVRLSLLEEAKGEEKPVQCRKSEMQLVCRPFEIVTLRLVKKYEA